MNERIRELAEQANLEIDPAYPDHNQKVLEKFALLIVRECAGIYDKIDNGNLHMGTDNYLEALNKTFWS